jgi:glycosyltransferase involved in cell wall biosynthesis
LRKVGTIVARSQLVFIPALNEDQIVAAVVEGVRRRMPDVDVLVIDDGSTDDTAGQARRAGAIVVSHGVNLGLGAAIQTGYRYAKMYRYHAAAHCDSDGQHTPESVERLLAAVTDGQCDLAVGSRFLVPDTSGDPDAYSPSPPRAVGIWVFRHLLSMATGQRFTDPTSGLRAANASIIDLFAENYGADYPELESLVRVARAGYTVKEVPVVMLHRKAGRSKITPGKTFFWVFNGAVSLAAATTRPRVVASGVTR